MNICRNDVTHTRIGWVAYVVIIFSSHLFSFQTTPFSRYVHDVFFVEHGLPENSISSIVKTPNGYLWLASQGLVRFDGKTFTEFNFSKFPDIPSNQIITLFVDADSAIWAGTYGGGAWRLKNDTVISISEKDGLSSNIVRSIVQDSSGTIWFGTNLGLDAYRDGKITGHFSETNGLPSSIVWTLFIDSKHTLWIGTYGGGVSRYVNGKFTTYSTKQGLLSNMIMTLNESNDGTLWIGTDGGGASSLKNNVIRSYGAKNGLTNSVVWTIYKDNVHDLWFGTHGGGLFRLKNDLFEMYGEGKISIEFITSITQDFENNLWIGTQGRGLHRLKKGKFSIYTTENGLSGNNLRTVYADRKGAVWVGTVGSGVSKFYNGKFSTVTTADGLSSNFIWTMLEDSRGNFWIGTGGAGLNKISAGKVTEYTTKNGLSNNFILSLLEDSKGNIWIGTNGGGLSKYSNNRFEHYSTRNGLSNDFVVSLFEAPNGALWIGTSGGGLNILEHGKFTVINKQNGLHTNYCGKIFRDSEGTIWNFGGGGITRYRNGNFNSYTSATDIFSYSVFGVLEDAKNNFWFSTSKGLFSVKRSHVDDLMSGRIPRIPRSKYDRNDGMHSSEFGGGSPASCVAKDGTFWFPSSNGLVVVDPENIPRNLIPPPVYIEQLLVDGKTVSAGDQFQLSSVNRSFEFHYTALSYFAPDNIQFKYKLEGFNDEWLDVGTRRAAYYTNISPGDYTFRVIAQNSDGVWNETGAQIAFTILPQFYETTPFYAAIGILVIILISGTVRYRENLSKKRETELITLVEERTKNLRAEKEKTELALLQTEEARSDLAESEHRYRNLIENINEAYFVLDPKGRIIYGSPNLSIETGYSVEELMGKQFTELVAHEDRRRVLREISQLLISKEDDLALELRGLRRDGKTEWIEMIMRVIRNETGNVKEYHNVVRRINDRKAAEEALRKSEERYRKFFMNDLTGDFSTTRDGRILQVNTSFVRIFGFQSPEHAQQTNIVSLYSTPKQWTEIIKTILAKQKIEYNEAELKNLNGETVYVIQNLVGLFDDAGNLVEVNGYIFDNTALKRLEEKLMESQKMESIGTLAGGIAHDFNNILAIILGYAQLLFREKDHPEKVEKRAAAIVGAGERASDLVRQLLTFARKGEMIFEPVNLNKIAKDVSSVVSETFPKTINVTLHIDRNIPEISAFSSHIHQALLNLCLNARDAMPDGGELKIATTMITGKELQKRYAEASMQQYVVLEVSDSGVGMDMDTKTRIYEPFFTTKERGRGTGLGLAVVYGIIRNHKGIIDLETKKGRGTTFKLYFPIQSQVSMEFAEPQNTQINPAHGTETLLLVEDEEMLIQLLQEYLEDHGYTVLTARDGLEAIRVFRNNAKLISLIIIDLGLPKLGGWESHNRIKEIRPDVPSIVVSGFLEENIKEEIKSKSGIEFIPKPYSPERLLHQIRKMLDKN